jgi:hypothetical protein
VAQGSPARTLGLALIGVAIGAGVFYAVRTYQKPAAGKADNVAPAPAGGRTQAQAADTALALDPHSGVHAGADSIRTPPPIQALGDPLLPGIPEQPDVPPDSPHAGLRKVGVRIIEAVEKDGTIGDHEVPGVDLTKLTQTQRRWYLAHAVNITCTCGCRQDLLECRRDDETCPISPGLSDSLLTAAAATKR